MSQTLAQLIQGVSVNASAPVGSLTVDSLGRVLVGTSTSSSAAIAGDARLQVVGNNAGNAGILALSRSVTAVNTAVLGQIPFADNVGVFAQIDGVCDGTPGTNDYPGRLVFSTTSDGAASPTERFRISNDGSFSSVIPGGSTLYPSFNCRAFVNFNGTGTVAIRSSGNVSSITDNGVGDYTVNFTTAMPDANYTTILTNAGNRNATDQSVSNVATNGNAGTTNPELYSTTQVRIRGGNTTVTFSNQDNTYFGVAIFR